MPNRYWRDRSCHCDASTNNEARGDTYHASFDVKLPKSIYSDYVIPCDLVFYLLIAYMI